MPGLIEISKVTKVFGKGVSEVHAFGPVDLTIDTGQFVSLLGPSGCGKSTLMLMLAGLLEPSAGEIKMNGRRVEKPQTDIGIMFQDNTLVPWRTVRGNVELQLELRGMAPKLHAERVMGLLRAVHLEDFAERYPAACSSAPPSARRWCMIRRSCCWTNLWASSTP
jgi:NitT/TauT family transport system ATP-binding protein